MSYINSQESGLSLSCPETQQVQGIPAKSCPSPWDPSEKPHSQATALLLTVALKRAAVDYRAGTSWACQPKEISDFFGQKMHIGNFLCQCQNVKILFKKLGAIQDNCIASSINCTCLKAMTVLPSYLSSLKTTVTGEAYSCNSWICCYISFTTTVVIVLFKKYIRSNVKHTVQLIIFS